MNNLTISGTELPATIIAVDNGNGNTKTEHEIFKSGVDVYNQEPTLNNDSFRIDGKYYIVGENHMTYQGDKTTSDECYVLTMAAVTKELERLGLTVANVRIAAGLPLGWCSKEQKEDFRKYLMKVPAVDVMYHGRNYHFEIDGVDVYPQGFAAICGRYAMSGMNMIADIGNGTINMMTIIDGVPKESSIHTERYGVSQCTEAIKKELSAKYSDDVSEEMFDSLLITGTNGRKDMIADIVRKIAGEYCSEVIKKICSYGFKEDLMKLYLIGGGGRIIKNFSDFWKKPGVIVIDDICANAKGYAYLSRQNKQRK